MIAVTNSVDGNMKPQLNYSNHREYGTIIILDTKLVSDFVLHACCFFIAGNCHVLMLLRRANKSITDESRAAKS